MEKETEQINFQGLGIADKILEIIKKLALISPTPIQAKSIPAAISGQDLIGIAQTGTGKTFAFGIPMIQRLALYKGRGLVILPTRELAQQVDENLRKLGSALGLRTAVLIGGEPINKQINALEKKPHILIATPGRLNDHIQRKLVKLNDIKILILDEADMMFDMGFAPQIEEILKYVPKERQTMLFSATMPVEIVRLAANHMVTPIRIEVAPAGTTAENVDQEIIVVNKEDRLKHLEKLLKDYSGPVLIFTRTKYGAKSLTKSIQNMGHKATEIHSNRSLGQRREALAGFKANRYRIMVATDIAARGIDVSGIELVINYDLPEKSEDYVHRIGRTARAGKKGKAISFALSNQSGMIKSIEALIRQNLPITQHAQLTRSSVYSSYGRRRQRGVPFNPRMIRPTDGFMGGLKKDKPAVNNSEHASRANESRKNETNPRRRNPSMKPERSSGANQRTRHKDSGSQPKRQGERGKVKKGAKDESFDLFMTDIDKFIAGARSDRRR